MPCLAPARWLPGEAPGAPALHVGHITVRALIASRSSCCALAAFFCQCSWRSAAPPAAHLLRLLQLADFGFSKDPKQQSEAKTRVGTPAYLAPEVIAAQPGKSYNAEVRWGGGRWGVAWCAGVEGLNVQSRLREGGAVCP